VNSLTFGMQSAKEYPYPLFKQNTVVLPDKRDVPFANLVAGGVAGLCSLVVGQPLDTVKVRLQTMSPIRCKTTGHLTLPYSGGVDCLLKTVKGEGVLSLFRGMSALTVFALPRSAIMFYSNSIGRNLVKDKNQSQGNLSIPQILFGGIFSQLIIAPLLVSPMERVKVILQTNPSVHAGQMACLKHIIQTEGLCGITRGSFLTLCRDVPSFCTFFLSYEQLRLYLTAKNGGELSLKHTAAIGGLAGILAWAVAIPADNLKSRYQANTGSKVGLKQLVMSLKATGGFKQLYRGAAVILIRAGPTNAATFVGYEWTLQCLGET